MRRCALAPAGRRRSRSSLRQVYPARNQIRTQLNGSQQRCLGYGLPPLISQQTAQIHPRRGKIRTPRQRPAIAGFSFFQSSHPGQHKSGCKVGLWKLRLQSERPIVAIERLLVAAHECICVSQAQVSGRQRWLLA